jgi:hypothetical protein
MPSTVARRSIRGLVLVCALTSSALLQAADTPTSAVVINEIFCNAADDLNELQFVELYNPSLQPVELGGWKLAGSARHMFPPAVQLPAGGYLVLCKDVRLFRKHYGFDAAGQFEGTLAGDDARLELIDNAGKRVDAIRWKLRSPWPVSPDGYGSSLERICPAVAANSSDNWANWAASPLPTTAGKPGGTPGKKNASFASRLPPVIANVTLTPTHAVPGEAVRVEADVRSDSKLASVHLHYRVAGPGLEQAAPPLAMAEQKPGRYAATIPGQKAGQIIRCFIAAKDAAGGERLFPHPNDLRPALSCYVHDKFLLGKIPFGIVINVGLGESPPARGRSAFVHVPVKTGVPELFDFIHVTPRNAGRKVRFHKDHTLDGMTSINLIYEYMDRFVLAEPLAYELYRLAGNAACRTDFLRTWVDGQPLGYQLLIEQPNKAFLKRQGLNTNGNLYKLIWFGQGVVGQHEKKTRIHEGHDDIVNLVNQLQRTRGDAQWELIQKQFDVPQVVNYFAVNMLLSHWDGYFNNYFAYHDVQGTGKWTMYPWDQDKTWGFHDGLGGYDIFTNMPITFGKQGDQPSANGGFWWRPAGYFSGPLLAHPNFRRLFLARTRELLEQVYTEEKMFPIIKEMGDRLEEEARVQVRIRGQDPNRAVAHLHRNLDTFREHLRKRRAFLLAQDEIKNVKLR